VQKVTKKLSEKIGVGIHNLDWREQLQVATMEYETGVVSGSKDFIKFADRYKLNGLKTFLSLEQGGLEMGKKILKIGEKFKETSEVVNAIFEKYAELVNAVEGVENYLKEQFKKEDPKLIQEIKENLLMRGKAILVIFADEEMTVEAVTERLKEIDTEVDILGAILRAMKNKGEKIDLNIVKDLSILSVYKLDENAINDVMALVKDSWDQNVKNNGVSADFAKVVINGLRGELESNRMDTEINILKYQDRPIGMIRFQIVDDKTLVVKSVNVHSRLKGINVGTFLFELIRKKSQEKNLKLDVLLKNQVSCHYISEIGFHGYGYNDNVKETNEPNIYAKLEKGKIKNRDEKYFTKQGGDIERIFNISTQKGLKEMRNFLKEHLLAIDDKGDIIEGQKYENKYTIVEQIQVGRQDDVRKIILRKNSVL
jgi:RNase H-fold protein (predicted Holliday junction resolvase)